MKPTFISEEKNLSVSENKGNISLRTSKSVLNIKHAVEGFDDSYKDLDRSGWEVTDFVDFQTGANGANILDDNKNTYVYYNYNDIPGSFIVDMKNEQILKGIEFQYKFYFRYWYATKIYLFLLHPIGMHGLTMGMYQDYQHRNSTIFNLLNL